MLASEILSQARDLANDTDATNPFHTDAKCYALITDWLHELGTEIGYPKKQQNITFAASAGGASGTKNLDNALSGIILAVWREDSSGKETILLPRTEAEMAALNPNWRDEAAGPPSYYIIQDAITAQTEAIGPLFTVTTDRPVNVAGAIRFYGLQTPAIISAGTNSPVFATAYHKSCVYYLAAHMMMPRNKQDADYYLALHVKKMRRCKTLVKKIEDGGVPIWDHYDGSGFTADRLSR